MLRLLPGLVRIPDVSFVSWARLPKSYGQIPPIAPDLGCRGPQPVQYANGNGEKASGLLRRGYAFGMVSSTEQAGP